ncbi:MAG: DUF72 domain-containing protein, partial [Thermoplasmata archaeon]
SPLWYDYTYSATELADWVPRVRDLTDKVGTVYGFFINHFRGDAAVNCRTLSEELGLSPPVRRGRLDA